MHVYVHAHVICACSCCVRTARVFFVRQGGGENSPPEIDSPPEIFVKEGFQFLNTYMYVKWRKIFALPNVEISIFTFPHLKIMLVPHTRLLKLYIDIIQKRIRQNVPNTHSFTKPSIAAREIAYVCKKFPPCMRQLQEILQQNKRLPHHARVNVALSWGEDRSTIR